LKNKKSAVEEKKHDEIALIKVKENISSDNYLMVNNTDKPNISQSYPFSALYHDLKHSRSSSKSIQDPSHHSENISATYSYKKFHKTLYQNQNKNKDSDTELIVLVILAIFPILSLIAVYLKDGKKATVNFWITLILHFLFFYWLFALLRVLDVINLA
jgi:hypothetical protein